MQLSKPNPLARFAVVCGFQSIPDATLHVWVYVPI